MVKHLETEMALMWEAQMDEGLDWHLASQLAHELVRM
jgi:hypothetical protein